MRRFSGGKLWTDLNRSRFKTGVTVGRVIGLAEKFVAPRVLEDPMNFAPWLSALTVISVQVVSDRTG